MYIQLVCFWSRIWPWSKRFVFFLIKFKDKTSLPITRLVLPLQVVLTKHSIFNRYQFFLQIKRDILQGRLPITFDEAAELFAFAVQGKNSWLKFFLLQSQYFVIIGKLFYVSFVLVFSWTSRLWPKILQWGLCLWISLCPQSNSGIRRTNCQISPASWVFTFMIEFQEININMYTAAFKLS